MLTRTYQSSADEYKEEVFEEAEKKLTPLRRFRSIARFVQSQNQWTKLKLYKQKSRRKMVENSISAKKRLDMVK